MGKRDERQVPAIVMGCGPTALGILRCLKLAGIPAYVACRAGDQVTRSRWFRPTPGPIAWDGVPGPQALEHLRDLPLDEAVRKMEQHHVKRLPVVGSGGLVGILSRADLLRAFVETAPDEAPPDLSDAAIARRIARALDAQAWASRQGMHADVRGGVVTLRGVLVNDAVRNALVVLVENMAGVVRVDDQLVTVEPLTGAVVRLPWESAR